MIIDQQASRPWWSGINKQHDNHGERRPCQTPTMPTTATINEYVYIYLSCICFYCVSYSYSLSNLLRLFVIPNGPLSTSTTSTRSLSTSMSPWRPPSKCNRNTTAAAPTTGTGSDNGNGNGNRADMQTTTWQSRNNNHTQFTTIINNNNNIDTSAIKSIANMFFPQSATRTVAATTTRARSDNGNGNCDMMQTTTHQRNADRQQFSINNNKVDTSSINIIGTMTSFSPTTWRPPSGWRSKRCCYCWRQRQHHYPATHQ